MCFTFAPSLAYHCASVNTSQRAPAVDVQREKLVVGLGHLMSAMLQPNAGTGVCGGRAQPAVAIAVDKRFLPVPHVACA